MKLIENFDIHSCLQKMKRKHTEPVSILCDDSDDEPCMSMKKKRKQYNGEIMIIYHRYCNDGELSLWIYKMFGISKEHPLLTKGYTHKKPTNFMKQSFEGIKKIIVLDLSLPKEQLLHLSSFCPVDVIDHHETSIKTRDDLNHHERKHPISFTLDMKRSACEICWSVFAKRKKMPSFVKYIGNADRWDFSLPDAKAFRYGLGLRFPYVSKQFDELYSDSSYMNHLIEQGKLEMKRVDKKVDLICRSCEYCHQQKCKVAYVESNQYVSEVGSHVLETTPSVDVVAIMTKVMNPSKRSEIQHIKYSLRSRENGQDVSTIAEKHGGGGHKCAAGFISPTWKIDL